jgi:glycosyltransferase involved in cell wall biosynthesis
MHPLENPLVSVVMPVYNADEYLTDSIGSILQQSFENFEFIIICDDPPDSTKNIIDSFQQQDRRIRVIYRKREGLVAALNTGCTLAQGKYIARMDADDISLPERLDIQVNFMEKHPDVGLCGSWARTFGESVTTMKSPVSDSLIKTTLLFYNPFIHPTIIIRKEILDSHSLRYDRGFSLVEDYELWVRLSPVTKFSNIDKCLLKYRIHPDKVSTSFGDQLRINASRLFSRQLGALDIPLDDEKLSLHLSLNSLDLSLNSPNFRHNKEFLIRINNWLVELIEANQKKKTYDDNALAKIAAHTWTNHCILATHTGFRSWNLFCHSNLSGYITLTKTQKMEYLIAYIITVDSLLKMKRLLKI